MATYRCNDCGTEMFSGDNLSGGTLRMACPNRRCKSRTMKPPKKQTVIFGQQTGAQIALGIGQKALRGSARRSR